MKCPQCDHVSETALLRCGECGQTYDRQTLEQFRHADYLLKWLEAREEIIGVIITQNLRNEVLKDWKQLQGLLLPVREPEPAPPIPPVAISPPPQIPLPRLEIHPDVASQVAKLTAIRSLLNEWVTLGLIPTDISALLNDRLTTQINASLTEGNELFLNPNDLPPISSFDLLTKSLELLDEWATDLLLSETHVGFLREYLEDQKAILVVDQTERENAQNTLTPPSARAETIRPASIPRTPHTPAPPAKPKEPLIQWNKVWGKIVDAAVSGLLLRWLRYLGAFLFVVSLAIVVISFWENIPVWGQMGIIFFIPTMFYGGGWFARRKLQVEQTGGVLMGVGALLLAVDFAAIYQLGRLSVPLPSYWFVTSLICTTVYLFTSWRLLQTEFFGYISLAGINSTLMSLVLLSGMPLEWMFVSLTVMALPTGIIARRLQTRGGAFAEVGLAFQRFPQIVLPVALGILFFVPGEFVPVARMVAFGFASVTYGWIAWHFEAPLYAHLACWGGVATVGLSLPVLNLDWAWWPSVGVVLAPMYTGGHLIFKRKLTGEEGARRSFQTATRLIGFALLGVGMAAGVGVVFLNLDAGITVWFLATAVLGGYALMYHEPRYVFAAAMFGGLPFSFWMGDRLQAREVPQVLDWLAVGWSGLATLYLGGVILLRKQSEYGKWLGLASQILLPLVLPAVFVSAMLAEDWQTMPALVALGSVILVYGVSAGLHDRGQFPGLSGWVNFLPENLRKAAFLWAVGGLIPIWVAVAWAGSVWAFDWLGAALVGLGLGYSGLGQWLARWENAYKLPCHVYAFGLMGAGILVAWGTAYALMVTLYLSVVLLIGMAVIYRSVFLAALAGLLLVWPFQISLNQSLLTPHAYALAYVLLAGLGYVPVGFWLKAKGAWRFEGEEIRIPVDLPILSIGFLLSAWAVGGSVGGRFGVFPVDVPWIGFLVPLVAVGLYVFSAYRFDRNAFGWAAVAAFSLAFWQAMTMFRIQPAFEMVGWGLLGIGYLGLGKPFARFFWPLHVGAWSVMGLGGLLSLPLTWEVFSGGMFRLDSPGLLIPPMLVQGLAVGFVILAAWFYRSRWPLFLEPWLAFVPVTLLFIGFGEQMFGQRIPSEQFGILWAGLALGHVGVAAWLEQISSSEKRQMSMMQGVYLGGYALGSLAVIWSLDAPGSFLWAMGLWLVSMVGSAGLVYFNRHLSWANVLHWMFGDRDLTIRKLVRDAFLWMAVWLFPVWVTVLLWQLRVVVSFGYLGYVGSALVYLGLARRWQKMDRVYAWPLIGAGQFFTALALWMTLEESGFLFLGRMIEFEHGMGQVFFRPSSWTENLFASSAGFVYVQLAAVLYYGMSSWYFQTRKWVARFFSYAASGWAFVAYTLAWRVFRSDGATLEFVYFWLGLAAGLLGIGYLLDGAERIRLHKTTKRPSPTERVGFAHGPYVVGYGVLVYALLWSGLDRWVNIVGLAGVIGLVMASHLAVHYERHTTFEDFLNFFWHGGESVPKRTARTAFLFVAAYGFPVWLAQVLTFYEVQLAWRGLALALTAPVYIAFSLAVRRVRSEYTWPLYSAGYALTALGAMVALDDPLLAMYVLALNAVVYASSAYIFQQAGWLYLSTVLVPIVGVMAIGYNFGALPPTWMAGWLMGLAFLYFGVGRVFDWKKKARDAISPYALPFYGPGYVLSALALAVGSGERGLAVIVYLAGVGLYGLSAWAFRETIFLYPAVWLAAVPYYLGMSFTRLDPAWYGVGWLPLIVVGLGIGRFVFHRKANFTFSSALTHPAMPFYSLAYALSLTMMLIARGNFTALTVAFGAASALYLGSAGLFRRAAWLYPGLLAGHLALFTYFAIDPSGLPLRYISLAFVPVTWAMGLIGGVLWKKEERLGLGSWATPFLAFAGLDVLVWQGLSLFGWETGIIVAVSHALLLGILAMRWLNTPLVWGSLGFLLLGVGLRLGWMNLPLPVFAAWLAGVGFGFYLTGRAVETLGERLENTSWAAWGRRMRVWVPLIRAGIGVNTVGAVIPLFFFLAYPSQAAAGLGFAGAMVLAIAYQGQYYRLGYVAVAMLELAFVLLLRQWDFQHPQGYALPAGLYFIGIGVFERRRGRGRAEALFRYAGLIEGFGLAVMLVTSFIQSLALENGFWYFLLLLVEGLAVIGWGAQQRRKIPFLIGLGASVVNVAGQVVVLFMGGSTIIRWVIFGGVGLLLLMAALLAERWLIPRAQELRGRLEEWA